MKSEWLNSPAAELNTDAKKEAMERQSQLTKPPGALGELENIAIQLAAMQGRGNPQLNNIHIVVFAGDHGIAANGLSAFPQAVTTEMVKNFSNGGAAISVLAKALNAQLDVINLGTVFDPGPLSNVIDKRIAAGTKDFSHQAAMSEEEFFVALNIGRQAAERAAQNKAELFIGGDMGIGNTTASTAITCALLNKSAEDIAGRGTGLDETGLQHKIAFVNNTMEKFKSIHKDPAEVLRHYGGFEIVALTGAFIACGKMGLPVLIDGFIATTAALSAEKLCPGSAQWFFYGHVSAEKGHLHMLEALQAKPLLDLGLRLGEGSGAATAVPLLQLACKLHNEMATFAEAEVSSKH